MNRLKRIDDLKRGLQWFKNASTCDIVKTQSGVCVDSAAHSQVEVWERWIKLNSDISEIYMSGTTEERNAIDEAFKNIDKVV